MKLDLFGWFPEENKKILEKLIKENDIKTVIEIGCFLGKSTNFFVKQGCFVYAIDTFEGAKDLNECEEVKKRLPTLYEQFIFNLKELDIQDFVITHKGTSQEINKEYRNLKADLVYIDGSHEYEDVVKDIILWQDRARKVLCGDDYSPHHEGVRKAVDQLLSDKKVNKKNRVWFLIK